jgi:hypothetical protein
MVIFSQPVRICESEQPARMAGMFTPLAFFLMAVVLMLAVIGDALWGHFRRRRRGQRR